MGMNTDSAFARYEAVRGTLPEATFPATSHMGRDLSDTVGDYDAYILDAFGVLNRGETAIAGAVERMAELRALGKRLIVLTNAASYTRVEVLAKYHRLGFDFTAQEVVSSRDVAFADLPPLPEGGFWAAAAAPEDDFSDAPEGVRMAPIADNPEVLDHADGILLLSSANWTPHDTDALVDALQRRPRPFVIANPDLVAPREDGLSIEPGLIAHEVTERTGQPAIFYGKPFGNAFENAIARLDGIPGDRIAMVGDTLHTDVLGGAAAGIGTILITNHGLFRGFDVAPYISKCGIRPSWIIETT